MDAEEQARFSRVQMVTARSNRFIDDITTNSNVSMMKKPSVSVRGADWTLKPAPLQRQRSQNERFEDLRPSLPSLTESKPKKRPKDSIPILAAPPTSSATDVQDHDTLEAELANEAEYADGFYRPVGSPMISSTLSCPKTDKSSSRAGGNDGRRPILTEVGESYPLPLFNKDPNGEKSVNGGGAIDMGPLDAATPHMSIEETQKYTFAIILKHTDQIYHLLRRRFPSKSAASIRRDLPYQVSQLQQKCVRRLIQAGLGVVILDNDFYGEESYDEEERQAGKNICILINPKKDKDLLLHEFKREMDELAIRQGDAIGRMGEESLDTLKGLCFSPALELQLTHNIIQNAFKDYEKDEWAIETSKELTLSDIVKECFPLHDRAFNRKFFAEYRKNTFDFNLRKTTTGNSDRWAVEELRLHFGERVAFLFAFMHIYTKHLLPITVLCVCYYICFRSFHGTHWREYVQGLAVIGFGVACFWGPSFLVCWERETRLLTEKWNLTKYKNTVYEKNDSNPDFQYEWKKNELTNEMEKVPKARRNSWIQLTMFVFVILSALVQCVCLVPFIQWYVYAKGAQTCDKCRNHSDTPSMSCLWFINCFNSETSLLGTDRWFYILLQGIFLGLMIDIIFFEIFNWISEKFVAWENYEKKSEHENRLIHRRFVFVWTNWFFWFLFLAFVYLPFGDKIVAYMRKVGLGILTPYEWKPSLLTLDTLFVTPLVVTQFLNMLLETVVPYLVRKLRGRPVACRKGSPFAWCARRLFRRFRKARDKTKEEGRPHVKHLTAKRLAALVKQRHDFEVPVLPCSDDCNSYSAYEVIAESKLPIFDPVLDYLDASIQFSYVIMFTIVWPLMPFPAFFNNLLEVRGDAFRLLFAHRRPMPRRDTSIGEWVTVLSYANIIGVTVVMAFVVVYHLGYFTTTCDYTFSDGDMIPFSAINRTIASARNCEDPSLKPNWIMIQIMVFVLLEHIGFCLRYLVLQADKTPSSIRSSGYQRLKQIQQLTSTRAGHASQFEYIQKLRELFQKYDEHGDGHIREDQLIPFLAEWICKHPSELMPYSSIIFRYMDKNCIGKVSFATCCIMLQHVHHDRFFSCLLGIYDPENGAYNEEIRRASDAMEFRRVMSEVSSVVSEQRRSSMNSRQSFESISGRARDSSFFYFNNDELHGTTRHQDEQAV